jgi:hypothetical protein
MTDIEAAVAKARDRVTVAIGGCYGGALGLAYVHGWRFRGEVTADDWPVVLMEALDHYGKLKAAVARVEAHRDRGCERQSKSGTCEEKGHYVSCWTCSALTHAEAELARLIPERAVGRGGAE